MPVKFGLKEGDKPDFSGKTATVRLQEGEVNAARGGTVLCCATSGAKQRPDRRAPS
jgi:hypothetical protein